MPPAAPRTMKMPLSSSGRSLTVPVVARSETGHSSKRLFSEQYPRLVTYYRNVAMLSRKAMGGIGLDTESYELSLVAPPLNIAVELACYFNKIVGELIRTVGVTPRRHIELAFANLGDSLQA
jgi:hypothetical protein